MRTYADVTLWLVTIGVLSVQLIGPHRMVRAYCHPWLLAIGLMAVGSVVTFLARYANRSPVSLLLVVASAAAIAGWLDRRTSFPPTADDDVAWLVREADFGPTDIIGTIAAPLDRRDTGSWASVDVEWVAGAPRVDHGRIRLFARGDAVALAVGDRIRFRSRLRPIANSGNPGEFDWADWNARRGAYVTAFAWDAREDVEVLDRSPGEPLAVRARRAVTSAARGGGSDARALVAALVSGDRTGLSRDARSQIRDAGLSHLLAISGLHMGLVVAAVLWGLHRGLLHGRWGRAGVDTYRIGALAAAIGLAGYAMLSGGGVSVARSVVMAAGALWAIWQGRRGSAADAMAAAALVLALVRPGAAREASFQLSFLAVAVLLGYAWRRGPSVSRGSRVLAWTTDASTVAVLAWAATQPIAAQHFHRVSFVAPAASVVATLPAAATVVCGLAAAASLAVDPRVAELLFSAAAAPASLLLGVARWFAGLPGAGMIVVAPGWPLAALLACLPFAVLLERSRRAPVAILLVAGCAGLVLVAAWQRYRADRLDATFVAVGQGDSTVVRLPGGRVLVVDAGPPGRGRIVVGPLLRRQRIAHIDYLVATHVQSDHWGGVPELAAEFSVGELFYPGGSCESEAFGRLVADLRARGASVVDVGATIATRGPIVREGPADWRLELLWPRDARGSCKTNDRSVVVSIRFAGRSLLLAGDVEAAGERELVRIVDASRLRADVLKVPHHGSSTSSTRWFLDAVQPRFAVASAGAANRYGFPHEVVIERYAQRGMHLMRTDRDGAVMVTVTREGAVAMAASRR